jgi:hypothetical protein
MKRTIGWIMCAVMMVGGVATVTAESFGSHGEEYEWDLSEEEMLPYNTTIEQFLDEHRTRSLDELTIGDLRDLGARLSVLAQEEGYVRSARQASQVMPGAGQFMVDAPGPGIAFAGGSLVVVAGTLVGTYFVLPKRVQFHNTDYINDSFREISTAWRAQSIMSLLPAFGVLVGGGIVHGILSDVAADDAERRARAQVDSGAKRFEPQPFIFPDPNGRLILGAKIGF